MRSALLLPLALFGFACDATIQEHAVLSGWNVTWDQLSHRVAYLETTLQPDTSLRLGAIGGNWSTGESFNDSPNYRVRYQWVETKAAHFVDGQTDLMVGPDGTATAIAEVAMDDLPQHSEVVAVIRGFAFDTDVEGLKGYPDDYDPAHGYTVVSKGVRLSEVGESGHGEAGSYTFEVQADFELGPADRTDMNAAMPYAQIAAQVSWTLIGFEGQSDALTVSDEQSLPWTPPYSEHSPLFATLPIDVDSRYRNGLLGWTAFTLSQSNVDEKGEYMRAMGAELVPSATQPNRGFTGNVEAIMSNSSLSEFHQIDMAFEGSLTWLGLADRKATVSEVVVEVPSDGIGVIETDPTGP